MNPPIHDHPSQVICRISLTWRWGHDTWLEVQISLQGEQSFHFHTLSFLCCHAPPQRLTCSPTFEFVSGCQVCYQSLRLVQTLISRSVRTPCGKKLPQLSKPVNFSCILRRPRLVNKLGSIAKCQMESFVYFWLSSETGVVAVVIGRPPTYSELSCKFLHI